MTKMLVAASISVLIIATSCSAEAESEITEAYRVRLDAESEAAELEAQIARAEADIEAVLEQQAEADRQRAEAAIEDAIEADYLTMANVVTSRVNELSLVDLDQDCLASGFRSADLPLVTDPGRPFAEFDATRVTLVMVGCGALDSYMKNLNQLSIGPTLSDPERACLGSYVGEVAGSDFELLLTAELMGEAGVHASLVHYDDVYSTTWEGLDACNIDW